MGCCSFACRNYSQDSQDLQDDSFADLSIESSGSKDKLMQVVQTEDASLSQTCRVRSTSCTSLQYSTQLETAFLFGTPQNSDRLGTMLKRSVNYLSFNDYYK